MPTDDLVSAAALDNARWCDTVCRTHGLSGSLSPRLWASSRRTPLFYPDAVTLTPGATSDEVLSVVDITPGCSIKDSFADLDLTAAGFHVLFEAQWITHSAPGDAASGADASPGPVEWRDVDADGFTEWLSAWSGGTDVLLPSLLAEPTVTVLAAYHDVRLVAGAVAHHDGSVIGLSNVFGAPDVAWPGLVAAASTRWPGMPLVGYEHGDDLTAALRHGFTALGPLRVWLH